MPVKSYRYLVVVSEHTVAQGEPVTRTYEITVEDSMSCPSAQGDIDYKAAMKAKQLGYVRGDSTVTLYRQVMQFVPATHIEQWPS